MYKTPWPVTKWGTISRATCPLILHYRRWIFDKWTILSPCERWLGNLHLGKQANKSSKARLQHTVPSVIVLWSGDLARAGGSSLERSRRSPPARGHLMWKGYGHQCTSVVIMWGVALLTTKPSHPDNSMDVSTILHTTISTCQHELSGCGCYTGIGQVQVELQPATFITHFNRNQ